MLAQLRQHLVNFLLGLPLCGCCMSGSHAQATVSCCIGQCSPLSIACVSHCGRILEQTLRPSVGV